MRITAIALDMDGTLLDSKNQIQENTIEILSELRKKGIKIFLVTGRTRKEIEEIIPNDFPYDGAVTSNGMGCYTREKEVMQYHLDDRLVEHVIALAQKYKVYYEVHSQQCGRHALEKDRKMMETEIEQSVPDTLKENEYFSRQKAIESGISWVNQLDYKNIVKIYFFSMYLEKIEMWKEMLDNMKQIKLFSTSSSTLHNVEMMRENVSKATGLNVLLRQFNLTATEVMAIGDGENDLTMFELCSIPIAMKNAPDIVKEKAHFVTKETHDNHGLYLFLKGWKEKGYFPGY
ncbi:HAD family hydrolase [Oceanobacillus sp. AG]|uniref:HAD family hydrolase n=1 Tax=Oceanobacillus sp. AG TaxID=2681969 RepID=UPI0012EB70B9|nr:HAD family hydrolase [Oceanobacillus sp. AG]